jgi:hypothetical protein
VVRSLSRANSRDTVMFFSLVPLFFLPLSVYSTSVDTDPTVVSPLPSLNLYHRLHHPIHASESPFVHLGSLVAPSDDFSMYAVQPANGLRTALGGFKGKWKELSADELGTATYQVALQRAGDTNEGHWSVSVVKACHITPSSSSTLVVRLSPASNPFAIDYFVSPVPHDGACPTVQGSRAGEFTENIWTNVTVLVKEPARAPVPELRAPPQLSPEGAPVEVVPEKTFFQKYWLYGVGIVIALALSGGAEEEKPAAK